MRYNHHFISWICIPLVLLWVPFSPVRPADWKEVQKMKLEYITLIAKHALEQQKITASPEIPIPFPSDIVDCEKMKIIEKNPDMLKIKLTGIHNESRESVNDAVRFTLPQPLNMLNHGSGIAVFLNSEPGSSEELRLGLRFISEGGNKKADILPFIPVVSRWGDETHEIYFDWSFINYRDVEDAVEVLKNVEAIEIIANSLLRAPERGVSRSPQSGTITISDMRLVDYLKGSFDPARHRWTPGEKPDLTLQHRCQEVTGVVANFGGENRIHSAIASLDMCVRTQCWDGSFLDGRRGASTVTSGEYTFGFTIYGLLTGYMVLDKENVPELEEILTIGPHSMTRKAFYQRMFYRSAMARAGIATPSKYRDDIIGGNTLITGANRVLGYAIGMRMVADILTDPVLKKEVLMKFNEEMDEITDAQGKFSGGFPILGEGDRFNGAGIHYDNGYTRTHMDWLIIGVNRTGDPRFIEMLRRYQTVFMAVMAEDGKGLVPLLSERGRSERRSNVRLVIPDATAQVGMKYKLPIIAQWGYNCGLSEWLKHGNEIRNFWSSMSNTRGYTLGAHSARLLDDFNPVPEPEDQGYLFPRQFPIWSAKLFNKQQELVKTSHVYVNPDGTMVNDFKIEIGLYPETVGVPVHVESPGGTVIATAVSLDGWPKLLPGNAELNVLVNGKLTKKIRPDIPFKIKLKGATEIVINGPVIQLPETADFEKIPLKTVFILEPHDNNKGLVVTLRLMRGAMEYSHEFTDQISHQ